MLTHRNHKQKSSPQNPKHNRIASLVLSFALALAALGSMDTKSDLAFGSRSWVVVFIDSVIDDPDSSFAGALNGINSTNTAQTVMMHDTVYQYYEQKIVRTLLPLTEGNHRPRIEQQTAGQVRGHCAQGHPGSALHFFCK